ncbi:hypothetical protein MKW94_000026, partial [Papaver nudicaule]|nr:hypothetical protein [Papaver nudicaule]
MDRVVEDHFELFNAAFTGQLNRFKRLALDHARDEGIGVTEAIANLRDNGKGLLHYAAEGGRLEVCRYLIETLKLDVDSKSKNGSTPLYWATAKKDADTVRYLLEKGANADASDDKNYTPLHCAAKT